MFESLWVEWSAASADVKSAVIGNIGIVAVAMLSLFGTGWFASKQLKHDREEKSKDRALELKKELLIQGVRGAQEMIGALSSAADLKLELSAISAKFQNGSAALVAASAVADIRTVAAGRSFVEEAGPAMMRVIAARVPAMMCQSDFDINQKIVADNNAETQRLLLVQKDAILDKNDARFESLRKLIESNRQLHETWMEEGDEIQQRLMPLVIDLGKSIANEVKALTPLMNALTAEVRRDVGIDSEDPSGFLDAVHIDFERLDKANDELMNRVKENVEKDAARA
jgi:hypothetical protein